MSVRARIERALGDAVAAGVPGVAAAVLAPDGETLEAAAGVRGLGDRAPMTTDTVFWIASFTKAVTSAAALQLVEEGRLDLDEPVGERLPMLAGPRILSGFDAEGRPVLERARKPITLRHLLGHTSGLGYEFCSEALTRYVSAVGPYPEADGPDAPLLFEPGSAWAYGIGVDWAGKLIAAAVGEGLDAWLARQVFAPLGMNDTSFSPTPAQRARLASMHMRGDDGALAPMPFEMPPPPHFGMGGGGLYATAGDYLRFLKAILDGGAPVFSPRVVEAMRAPHWEGPEVGVLASANGRLCVGFDPSPGEAKRWGLGFLVNGHAGPNGRSAGSLAWAGLGNGYYWADPSRRVAGVFLAQYFPFGDAAALAAFGALERAVYGA